LRANIPGRNNLKNVLIIVVLALTLFGCTSAAKPAGESKNMETAVVEAGTKVAMEEGAKSTVIAKMTLTQAAMVTSTPIATPLPAFAKHSVLQVQEILLANNLEFVNPTKMTKDDYGMAPMNTEEALHFGTPSICADCGGRLYSFSDINKLNTMKKYYDMLGEGSAMLFSWTFAKDNILIQIGGDMPEDRAHQYEAALNSIK
jgi:hypothetical protein